MIDYIIIGQGLAGTVLSHTLNKKGKKIIVAEIENPDAASKVAAGIYNPITGKRLVKTWKANEIFPFLDQFYKEMEKFLNGKFLHEFPIYRPFESIAEQNHWVSQSAFSDIEDLVNVSVHIEKYSSYIKNQFSGFETFRSGYLDLKVMLSLYKSYLIENDLYVNKLFDPSDIVFHQGGVEWNKIRAKKIIFCEGAKAISNPFFSWLPFVLSKGELLTIKAQGLGNDAIINKGVFIMPIGNDEYKVGATYQWDYKDNEISESALQELTQKLNSILKVSYKIIKQEAGIRPTVKDRRPFVGLHPEFNCLGVFNGLGTKGVSLAPYYANKFCNFLENGEHLDQEVNIERFIPLYRQLRKDKI